MVDAGFSRAAEPLRRRLAVIERADYTKALSWARAGDQTVGVTLCQTVGLSHGYQVLPADLLPLCERGLADGHLGIAPVLLRHHRVGGTARAATYYAGLCATLPVNCATELADFHYDRSGKSPAWELWDAVAGVSAGIAPSEVRKPAAFMRQVLSIRVRIQAADRACLARRYDAATRTFAAAPACPWRRPIAIPADVLGGSGVTSP
jgi:hypothetical protein